MTVERADFDDLVTLVSQAPPWEKDRAAGVRILLRAIGEGKANAPDQILQRWTWKLAKTTRKVQDRRASAEFPEAKRLLGAVANSRGHRHEENVPEAHPGREGAAARRRRRAARLLRGLHAAREQRARPRPRGDRRDQEIANALADNLPAPKAPSRKSRRRKRKKKPGEGPGAAAAGGGRGRVERRRARRGRRRRGEAEAAAPPAQAVERALGRGPRARRRTAGRRRNEERTMLLLLAIGFVAGVVTALSPCVLPVLPIVLAGGATGRRPLAIVAGIVAQLHRLHALRSLAARPARPAGGRPAQPRDRAALRRRALAARAAGRRVARAAAPVPDPAQRRRPRRRLPARRQPRARLRPLRRPGARRGDGDRGPTATSGSTASC